MKRKNINKESKSQQAVGYSLSLQMGTNKNNRSKLRGIKPIWSNKKTKKKVYGFGCLRGIGSYRREEDRAKDRL